MGQATKEENANDWMHFMLDGNFENAWKFSDEVLRLHQGKSCWHLPRHLQYVWNGASLEGKRVLIRCYHGLGDTIQFIRLATLVKEKASKVTVWVQPALMPLLKTAEGIDQLLPLHDGSPEVEYDVDVEVMELPHIFRINTETISAKIPYLHIEPIHLQSERTKPAVGLVWQPGDWGEGRSIPFSFLEPLAVLKGIDLYILQANASSYGWKEGFGIHPGEFNLYDYARIIKGLDLVISIDSMPAHLAGALGIPVWTLLRANADWRWMKNRSDSLWYPTMRIFRQKQEGEWALVIRQVVEELEQLASSRKEASTNP